MKSLFIALVMLVSGIGAQAQVKKILITTPDKEAAALEFLKKSNSSFRLTILSPRAVTMLRTYLDSLAHVQQEKQKQADKGVMRLVPLTSEDKLKVEPTCYFFGGFGMYGFGNMLSPYSYYSYSPWSYSQPSYYYYNSGRTGFGIMFGLWGF